MNHEREKKWMIFKMNKKAITGALILIFTCVMAPFVGITLAINPYTAFRGPIIIIITNVLLWSFIISIVLLYTSRASYRISKEKRREEKNHLIQLNNEDLNTRSLQSRSYKLPKSALYIGAERKNEILRLEREPLREERVHAEREQQYRMKPLQESQMDPGSHHSSSYYLAISALYIGAFVFYIIGIIVMLSNSTTINGMGLLNGAPYVGIGLILTFVGILIGANSSITIGKILLGFGGFLLFVSLIPFIAIIIFSSVGGW